MEDNFISYSDISDGLDDVFEKLEKKPNNVNITQELVTLLEIADTSNQIDNSVKNKKRKLNKLYKKLNHLYNEIDKRNNSSYRQKRSKNVLENITWDDERTLVTPKDKIETLQYIKQKALVIDSFVFTDENESPIKCLSVALGEIDTGYNNDEEPIVFIIPEFVLNETGHIQQELEDMSFEIGIDQIKEIVVDKIKYTFLY